MASFSETTRADLDPAIRIDSACNTTACGPIVRDGHDTVIELQQPKEPYLHDLIERAIAGGWTLFGLLESASRYAPRRVHGISYTKKRRVIVELLDPTGAVPNAHLIFTREQIFFGDDLRFLKALFPSEEVDRLGYTEHQLIAISLVLTPAKDRVRWLHHVVWDDDDDQS